MKVKHSSYIMEQKPVLEKLLSMLLDEFEFATILAMDASSKKYQVARAGTNISVSEQFSS